VSAFGGKAEIDQRGGNVASRPVSDTQPQKLLLGKMIVEGHSAGRNFCRNLISASPSWHASKLLEADATERANHRGSNYMKLILALAIYFAIWTLVIWGSIYFNKNVR